ncbi:hypothetical protein MTO96_030704, partial [Rhipicephalus appendiculatus]
MFSAVPSYFAVRDHCVNRSFRRDLGAVGFRHFVVPSLDCQLALQNRAIPSASNDSPFPENATQELEDAIAAEEYMKTLLEDSKHEQLFSTIKSQMSELTDQVRNQQSKLDEIPRALAASERNLMAEIAQVGASIRSAMSDQPWSPNPTEESAASSSSPQDSEKIYRRLEIFIDPSLHTLEELPKFSVRHGVLCATAVCESVNLGCRDR